ncbi:helix-turn-helix domain-containing protein [Nonomuraea sp. B19D2]|uniref:TetR/AcrR family transcriptional regulator n=1 Tax=Nonomuraea sp. B19D2 TaxID=3159561 RepID=UPI0032D9B3A4
MGEQVPEAVDLTARARMREAAMRLFAEKGYAATSVADIAKAAGVSGGLIRHHFGSKAGLRRACDQAVVAELAQIKEQNLARMAKGLEPILDRRRAELGRYLGRSVLDGSEFGAQTFRNGVDMLEAYFRANPVAGVQDVRGFAATVHAFTIGTEAMYEVIAAALDADPNDLATLYRIHRVSAQVYSSPIAVPGIAEVRPGVPADQEGTAG